MCRVMGTVTAALHWDTSDTVPSRLSVRVRGEGSELQMALKTPWLPLA